MGCVSGDVCVVLKLEPHDRFLCSGSDLATDITVSLGFIYHIRVSVRGVVYAVTGHIKAPLLEKLTKTFFSLLLVKPVKYTVK